jgi:hypothetical protein
MGIDVHALNFLRFAKAKQIFGSVATIGRQALHVPKDRLAELIKPEQELDYGGYCEKLLTAHFAATLVESFDNSTYEGATYIADMNKPLAIQKRYDTVIDGGCLEHIYNAPQALDNVSQMCSAGGQILHILPANNFCGHGFWQFSPELFFSLYSEANGYKNTQVFLADLWDERFWFEVKKPRVGSRVSVISKVPVYALVRTNRTAVFSHQNVQQSDYVYEWNQKALASEPAPMRSSARDRIKKVIKGYPVWPIARLLNKKWKGMRNSPVGLSDKNPHLVRLAVSTLM